MKKEKLSFVIEYFRKQLNINNIEISQWQLQMTALKNGEENGIFMELFSAFWEENMD